MRDPRIDRLGELIAGWSLDLREGQTVLLDVPVVAAPLGLALHRAALRRGARPILSAKLPALEELILREGSDDQLDYESPLAAANFAAADAVVTVWADTNTRSRSRINPERERRRALAASRLTAGFRDRRDRGDVRWCGVLFPTHAHAQDAGLSFAEFEDLVLSACHVDGPDAEAHWRGVSAALAARAAALAPVRELRIVADGTDLTLSVAGRRWQVADGRSNLPDGEIYTSPVETSASGTVSFGFPLSVGGRELDGVRLRFEDGVVVHAEARTGQEYLRALIATDSGASRLGEIAFGLNPEITAATGNVLLDEKIGGTMHLALGRGMAPLGGTNVSAIHTDLVIDTRTGAEVWADGEVVFRDGRFLDGCAA